MAIFDWGTDRVVYSGWRGSGVGKVATTGADAKRQLTTHWWWFPAPVISRRKLTDSFRPTCGHSPDHRILCEWLSLRPKKSEWSFVVRRVTERRL